jgi:cytochrome c oxidase cbb3-type subunit 3
MTPDTPEEKKAPGPAVHVYDDIQEEDNQLPNWWLWILYGTTAFAAFYWFGDQKLKTWAEPREVYEDQMVAVRLAQAKAGGGMSAGALVAMSKQPAKVAEGKATFTTTCAPCHRGDGGGVIGPNLTDEFWLHGSAPDKVWKTVHDGVVEKGMAAWGPVLGEERVASVVAYVLTLKNTNVPNGKAPQGEREP